MASIVDQYGFLATWLSNYSVINCCIMLSIVIVFLLESNKFLLLFLPIGLHFKDQRPETYIAEHNNYIAAAATTHDDEIERICLHNCRSNDNRCSHQLVRRFYAVPQYKMDPKRPKNKNSSLF